MSIATVTSIIRDFLSFSSKITTSGLFTSTMDSTSWVILYVTKSWVYMYTVVLHDTPVKELVPTDNVWQPLDTDGLGTATGVTCQGSPEESFNLTYLCFSMAYRRFTNLQEKFRGDLVAKVNEDVESLDCMDRPCNCSKHCFVNVM
eukprot:15365600-Ditylum_brightwellii.AAC.1